MESYQVIIAIIPLLFINFLFVNNYTEVSQSPDASRR